MKMARLLSTWLGLVIGLTLAASAFAIDRHEPSSNPPGGLSASRVPQFVVLGFDDNTSATGMDWVNALLANKRNPAGRGYANTYDRTPARASFYMNTHVLNAWLTDPPEQLRNSLQRLKYQHEIGNHTDDHHADLDLSNWSLLEYHTTNLSANLWAERIQRCTSDLKQYLGRTTQVTGFRAPFLRYNQAMFDTLRLQGFTYDTSIEEGYAPEFNGTNLRWPYTLHNGSPGHTESWAGNPYNPTHVQLTGTAGLWELPTYVLMLPDDATSINYGIEPGLQARISTHIGYLSDRITGFDYNLWAHAKVRGNEFSGILKYNLDLRLQGNHAPLTIGLHSQYYADPTWASLYAPQTTLPEMQAALRDFIEYALGKPAVRIRPARDVIKWVKNPVPLR